jgi:hypothetical protein
MEDATAKAHFRSVDEHMARQPEAAQAVLRRLRRIIRRALPVAERARAKRAGAGRRG